MFCEKLWKNRLSYMKCSILVPYWPNIGTILYFVTVCGKYIRLLAQHRKAEGYVSSARKRRPKGSVAESKVIQKLSFIRICRYDHRRTVLWCSDAAAPGKLNSAPGHKRAAGADLLHKLAIGIRQVIQTETMGNSSQACCLNLSIRLLIGQ